MKQLAHGGARILIFLMALCMVSYAGAEEVPYLQKVPNATQAIYRGPGYDYACTGIVEEAGTYTIVEESMDAAGRLWGRLKSGRGWIDLTDVRKGADDWVEIRYADADLMASGAYHAYTSEQSEYTVYLLFRPKMPLKNVQLLSFDVVEAGLGVSRVLYALPDLQPDMPLLAGVVFYGDMTTYGLSATDDQGHQRCYTVSVSGYDGSLVVEECRLIVLPEW